MSETIQRRLKEELGITNNVNLKYITKYKYYAELENNLIENEIDYIFIGYINSKIKFNINPLEVNSLQWLTINSINEDLIKNSSHYTIWFNPIFNIIKNYI